MGSKSGKTQSRGQQIALSLLLGTVSIAASAYVVLNYSFSVNTHMSRIAEVALSETSREVGNWVEAKGAIMDTVAKAMLSFKGDRDEIRAYLETILDGDQDFIDIFYGTAEPPHLGGYSAYGTGWVAPEGYDWTTRGWFTQALGGDAVVVSTAYRDLQTGQIIFSISKRVFSDGRLVGVLAADISTATVKRIIDGVFIADNSVIHVIDKDGQYIGLQAGEGTVAAAGNAFMNPVWEPRKAEILQGGFSIRSDGFRDSYYAAIGLPRLGWIMLVEGSLSSFVDARDTAIRFMAVLLLIAALFMALLVRTWRTSARLVVATEAVEEANRGLERTVEERTASLRNILDNAEEGFLTFGPELTVDPSYSKGCAEIFGKAIEGLSVPDLLFPGNEQVTSDFRQGFGLFFAGKAKAQIIFDLTEKRTQLGGRVMDVAYKETAGRRVLCILTDVTLATETAEKNRAEAETHRRILRALNNKHFFAQFLDTANELFASLDVYASAAPSDDELTLLARAMHTFKGDAGFFGFSATQALAHDSETLMADSRQLGTTVSWKEMLMQLRKAYSKELRSITDTMGEKWIDDSGGVLLPRADFQKLVAYVRKRLPDDSKLLLYLDSFRKITLNELFSRLPFAAAVTAERLGKKVRPMAIHGGTPKVVPDRYQGLAEACVHIVNNMIDHGIEYPYEREAVQKPPEGTIMLSISVDKSSLQLEFSDDGRGLNPREIERAARERGLIPAGRSVQNAELYDLIFKDGFTTKAEATTTSGRGVGLAAVRAEVEKLGGTIEARSKFGKGSVFEITIPMSARG